MTSAVPLRLVVLFGGRSAEHQVSCVSAASVLRALDRRRYEVVPVGITPDGDWVRAEEATRLLAAGDPDSLPPALEAAGPTIDPFDALGAAHPAGRSAGPTVVLPLLHGPFGEDGTVQGLCELAGVPYVGSGVLGSAVAMDKITAKRLLVQAGIAQPRFFGLREWDIDGGLAHRVGDALGWPVFVKPSNLGSSVGVSRVETPEGLDAALELALRFDEWVVVEEAIAGRELECAVLGDRDPQASVVGEIRPSREFYDYDDKYVAGSAELIVPAAVPDAVADEVRRLAVAAFGALRAEGMGRVDLFYEPGGRGLLVNEMNTIPGFTPISMYPRLWAESGMPYPELLDRLVAMALARSDRRGRRIGAGRDLGREPRPTGGPQGM